MIDQEIIIVSILLRAILLFMNLYFVFEIYRKYQQYRINVVLIIGIINVLAALSLVIEIIHLYTVPEALFNQIGLLYTLLGICIAYLLLIYLDLYENTHLNAYRLTVTTSLASFSFIANIETVTNAFYEIKYSYGVLLDHIPLMFIFYILYTNIATINRMKKYVNTNQIRFLNYISYYVYFGFVGYSSLQPVRNLIWPNNNEFSIFEQFWVLIIPPIMLFTGNIFLYLGYIKPNQPSVLSPQKVDRFLIITDEGIPVFNYEFEGKNSGYNESLLSGALSAISAVLREATNIVGDLKSIEIGDRHLLLRRSSELTGIIFTYRPTSFLDSLFTDLMSKVSQSYSFDKYGQFTYETFQEIMSATKKSFGYNRQLKL